MITNPSAIVYANLGKSMKVSSTATEKSERQGLLGPRKTMAQKMSQAGEQPLNRVAGYVSYIRDKREGMRKNGAA